MEASPFRFKMNILLLKSSAFPNIKCLKIDDGSYFPCYFRNVLNRPSPTLVNPRGLHHVLGEVQHKRRRSGAVDWLALQPQLRLLCLLQQWPAREGKTAGAGAPGGPHGALVLIFFFFSYGFYQEQWWLSGIWFWGSSKKNGVIFGHFTSFGVHLLLVVKLWWKYSRKLWRA